ncbi:MAG: tetratricopeptide repeat protein [Leptospiraceae bacterium]|nr:tetratricopeptide repeat protein [Leptospiraceae bacterium]
MNKDFDISNQILSTKNLTLLPKYFFLIILITLSFLFPTYIHSNDILNDAKKAYSQRQFQKSTKLFLEYTKKNSGDGEPYMFLGYIYEMQKDYETSNAYFRKAVDLKLKPNQKKMCLLKLMIFYNYHRSYDYVVHYGNRFLKLEPGHKEVTKMRDRALANSGHDPGYIASNVTIEKKSKEKKEESSKSKEEKKDSESKEKNKKESSASKKEPEQKEPKEKKETHVAKKETSEAKEKEKHEKEKHEKELAKKEEEWISKQNEKNDRKEESELFEKALVAMKKEEFQIALEHLNKLIEKKPDNGNYHYKAGLAHLRLGELEKSVTYFDEARKHTLQTEKELLYYINLNEAQANQKLGKTQTAIEQYRKAYSYKHTIVPLLPIIKLKYDAKEFADSEKYSSLVLKIDSRNLDGLFYRGISDLQIGNRYEGFRTLLEVGRRLKKEYHDPTKVPEKYKEAFLYLGVFYSNRIKYKLSLKYLKLAKNLQDRKSYKFAHAKSNFYLGKYEQALAELEAISEIPEANYLQAKYYSSKKDIAKVKQYLQKAANKKVIFWIKVKLDQNFKELMQNPEFAEFVRNKGEKPKIVSPNDTIPETIKIEEKKEEPVSPKIEESIAPKNEESISPKEEEKRIENP